MSARIAALRLRVLAVSLVFAALVFAVVPAAFAGNEGGSADPARTDCEDCHTEVTLPDVGPHGFYNDPAAIRCGICHDVHKNPGGVILLVGDTIKDSCNTCHDGTGGQGVYGALLARGITPKGAHDVDTTNTIPGGNAATGGSAVRLFSGVGGKLGCDDCHNPHDASTVNPFRGERFRGGLGLTLGYRYPDTAASSKLLKRRPSGSTSETAEYGSDWCAGCHAGRMSGGAIHNHPVDSKLSTATPFDYNHVALVSSDGPTNTTVLGSMTRTYSSKPTNRGYLMPWPRTSEQGAHLPICQQCHEDSRLVGTLSLAGADPATFTITPVAFASQYPVSDNPRFQNFPHETANERMLVETADDLCTNCHPTTILP